MRFNKVKIGMKRVSTGYAVYEEWYRDGQLVSSTELGMIFRNAFEARRGMEELARVVRRREPDVAVEFDRAA
ncbi:MAG: hypothetical protein AB1898_17965 [Acidobacteriota bacterium]